MTLSSGKKIEATAEHPFYIKGKGWNPAGSLKVGQVLVLHNGTSVVVEEVDSRVQQVRVYNFSVANAHNYYGGDGVLVHNVVTIGGRKPINSKYAGKEHPSGIKFTEDGFPDFSKFAIKTVKISGLTGTYYKDAQMANKSVGLSKTPDGCVWHHVEDGRTMLLLKRKVHQATRHTGGAAIIKRGIDND